MRVVTPWQTRNGINGIYGPSPSISQHIPDQSEAPEAPEAPTNAAQKVCVGSAVVPWPGSTSTGSTRPRVSPSATESRFFLGAATQLATQDISQFYNKTGFWCFLCFYIDKYEIICIWLSTSDCFRIFSICFHSCSNHVPMMKLRCWRNVGSLQAPTSPTWNACAKQAARCRQTLATFRWLSALGRGLSCS